ncbi:mechanosensitive ion channel protein MscS [Pseudomonas sp. NZIPFR-PS5]|nr:mechanosensitive ion channel protein MscS [Pseudomonas sp. NZIPFR-PS5]
MQHATLNRFYAGVLSLLLCITVPAFAQAAAAQVAPQATTQPASQANATPEAEAPSLDDLSEQLDQIRQKVTVSANDDLLSSLRQAALQVQKQADDLIAKQAVDIEHLNDQLNILGPVQPDEAPTLTSQRKTLTAQKNALVSDERQTNTLSQSARDLATQIFSLRRSLFDSQISTRTASPLSSAFWSTLIRPTDDDLRRMNGLLDDVRSVFTSALAPGNRLLFASVVIGALLIWVVVRRLLESLLIRLMVRWLPEGRLRRSALALAVGLSTVVTITAATSLLRWGIVSNAVLSNDVVNLLDQLQTLITFCAFIVGLGRALLMLPHPSWRLPNIPDEIATAMGRFPAVLALALMIIGTQERINSVIASSLALTVAVNGLTALAVSLVFFFGLVRYRRTRRRCAIERPGGLAGLIPFVVAVWVGLSLLALLSGYLTLAYFLAVKLLWMSVVASTAYLLVAFFGDVCETLLSPKQPGGMALGSALGLSPRHQAQASTVLAGVGRSLLLLAAVLLAFLPSGSSPGELLESFTRMEVTDKSLGALNIVPSDILMALGCLVAGLFGVRVLKDWFGERLLPETNMDAGMQASLVTLIGYIGFVLVIAVVMSTLHISLTNLTWVVSALSVGIGFGLQAIVQNFISGLILLTERPVKVGDWVSLAGVEGDIRRINVRATEIQMSDRSTVIVPNSQFITQNVRNVTMGNALGVVGISLTLPLETDVLQIRELLLQAFTEHEAILDTPAPSVTFKDLTNTGLIISASGFVNSPRSVGGARSDLLFTVLGRLREMGIALSAPQSMVLINDGLGKEQPPAVVD